MVSAIAWDRLDRLVRRLSYLADIEMSKQPGSVWSRTHQEPPNSMVHEYRIGGALYRVTVERVAPT